MVEMDIVEGKLGAVGDYDMEFKGGALSLKIGVAPLNGVSGALQVSVAADPMIDLIFENAKKAIPGEVDDAILSAAQGFLKKALAL